MRIYIFDGSMFLVQQTVRRFHIGATVLMVGIPPVVLPTTAVGGRGRDPEPRPQPQCPATGMSRTVLSIPQ